VNVVLQQQQINIIITILLFFISYLEANDLCLDLRWRERKHDEVGRSTRICNQEDRRPGLALDGMLIDNNFFKVVIRSAIVEASERTRSIALLRNDSGKRLLQGRVVVVEAAGKHVAVLVRVD